LKIDVNPSRKTNLTKYARYVTTDAACIIIPMTAALRAIVVIIFLVGGEKNVYTR